MHMFKVIQHVFFFYLNEFYFVLTLEKYGVIPKKCFPESHSSEASRRMNHILNHKVCFSILLHYFTTLFYLYSSNEESQIVVDHSLISFLLLDHSSESTA